MLATTAKLIEPLPRCPERARRRGGGRRVSSAALRAAAGRPRPAGALRGPASFPRRQGKTRGLGPVPRSDRRRACRLGRARGGQLMGVERARRAPPEAGFKARTAH